MENICTDILKNIKSYLGCYLSNKGFYQVNKRHNSLYNCKIIAYKSIQACVKHTRKKYLFNSIYQLKDAYQELNRYKYVHSIHFESLKAFNISRKYFNDFGEIDHYCCQGRGVMYDNTGEYFFD